MCLFAGRLEQPWSARVFLCRLRDPFSVFFSVFIVLFIYLLVSFPTFPGILRSLTSASSKPSPHKNKHPGDKNHLF
jgi:hypothetical protein